jgi:tetratricopeptide (TPR) repeat protein
LRFVAAVLTLAALAWGQAASLDQIERAMRLTREHKFAEARALIGQLAKPSDARLRVPWFRLRAAIASGLGEHQAAAEEMRQALALAPKDANLLFATAVAERTAGLLEEALKHAETARGIAKSPVVETLIGDIQEQRGKYVEAAQAYQRAAELAPDKEQYRLNLALELVRHHTFEPGIAVLRQAAADFPQSPRIPTLLGVAYFAIAKTEDAVGALAGALRVQADFAPARSYLGRISLDATTPDPRAVESLCLQKDALCAAVRLRANRDDASAFGDLQQLAQPGDPVGHCELARAYEWREDWEAARPEMEACVKLEPGNPQHHYRMARIYQRLGLAAEAQRETELQKETARRAADEVQRREQAVQVFQYVIRQ